MNTTQATRTEIKSMATKCGALVAEPSDAWNKHTVLVYGTELSVRRTLAVLGVDVARGSTYNVDGQNAGATLLRDVKKDVDFGYVL
jgi:hypothetical protein